MPSHLTSPADPQPKPVWWREFLISLALYVAFAAGVFFAMGPEPLLGSDHLTYMRLAEEIAEKRPDGNYLPEINSVRSFGVMLAWLHPLTGSHILSMKLLLAAISLPYLLSAELLLSLFTTGRWKQRLFAVLAGFALSFGVASWGITDYTALMPRTLVMPAIFFCTWFYLRFPLRAWRYAVFPILILFSVVHLSTFYCMGILGVLEVMDILFLRRPRIDRRFFAFPASVLVALALLLKLEQSGIGAGGTVYLAAMIFPANKKIHSTVSEAESVKRTGHLAELKLPPLVVKAAPSAVKSGVIPVIVDTGFGAQLPLNAASGNLTLTPNTPITPPAPPRPQTPWELELSTRAWRNMPLPWVNVANIFSSFGLIFLLACAGARIAFRNGTRELDVIMMWWVVANIAFALGPQTALWILRQFTRISPINIEEIRALSYLMIPALYFCVRLFDWLGEQGGRAASIGRTSVVVLYLALPLVMKSLTPSVREMLLTAMVKIGVVSSNNASINNARSALGLTYSVPLYYPIQGVSRWLTLHGEAGSLVLTDRDDMLIRNFRAVGSRQEVALQYFGTAHADVVLRIYNGLKAAFARRDLTSALILAKSIDARYLIVPWSVEKAVYRDADFSLLDLHLLDLRQLEPSPVKK